ncbi:hypothetical protein D3C79_906200 [compost metagenome]
MLVHQRPVAALAVQHHHRLATLVVLDQGFTQGCLVTVEHLDRRAWQLGRRPAGPGFLAGNRRGALDQMLGRVDHLLLATVVVDQHHPGVGRRREGLGELHEVLGRTATPAVDRLPVVAHAQQRRMLGMAPGVHRRAATTDLGEAGAQPADDLR